MIIGLDGGVATTSREVIEDHCLWMLEFSLRGHFDDLVHALKPYFHFMCATILDKGDVFSNKHGLLMSDQRKLAKISIIWDST